jgi:hypothetical protein
MNAALLSVIGTLCGAIIGWVGSYLTTSKTTARTLRVQTENTFRQLDAAHGQNLQDMQAPAYEQAIAALIYRRTKREHDLRPFHWDQRTKNIVRSTLDDYRPSNWYESQSKLALYASQVVLDANAAANNAHENILSLMGELVDLREAATAADPDDRDTHIAFARQHKAIFEKIQMALKTAATADDNLIQLMRKGVHTRPSEYLIVIPIDPGKLKTTRGWLRRDRVAQPPPS